MNYMVRITYTLLPVILAGVCNMILVKLPVFTWLKRPMDGGAVYRDGRRLFGDNKTWKGFLGMIFLTGFWMWFFGFLDTAFDWAHGLSLFDFGRFSPLEEWIYGCLWGLGYVLFELPNSFVKRRIGIPPGRNRSGFVGNLFKFVDQADSVIGCMLFMLFFYVPTFQDGVAIFVAGVVIHFAINLMLYAVGLKGQAG